MIEAFDEILAIGLHRDAQHFGIGEHEIGRRHRIGKLLCIEADAFGLRGIDAFDLADGGLQPVRRQQVGLLDEIEDLIFLPILVAETLVARSGRHHRLDAFAHHAACGVFPQIEIIVPQRVARFDDLRGVVGHRAQQIAERAADVQRIARLMTGLLALAFDKVREQLLGLLADTDHVAGEFRGVGYGIFGGGNGAQPWFRLGRARFGRRGLFGRARLARRGAGVFHRFSVLQLLILCAFPASQAASCRELI